MTGNSGDGKTAGASRRVLLLALLLGLAAGVLTAVFLLADFEQAGGPRQVSSGKALIGGPFSLVDAEGNRVTEKDFAGKPMLVFFGFTNCPDVCPSGLQIIAAALDRLGDKATGLAPIFITVDPERDTPEVTGQYVASFHSGIVGLSGSAEDVEGAIKAYRVFARKVEDHETPGHYNVDHSAFLYLMDENGEFVKHFPHSVDADTLATELAKVL